MVRSFTDAVRYVNLNENIWVSMINECWKEWISENVVEQSDSQDPAPFRKMTLEKYGIQAYYDHDNLRWDYHVVDPVKYTLFQMKYAQ